MIKKIFWLAIVLVLLYWFYHSDNFWLISWWIALFLFWMIFIWQWFKELTWWWFDKVLKKFTDKTWKSLTLWAFWAALMQSSSLVTIIAISFLSADLIPLAQWIAISLGSNIWTTTWAWIMAHIWWKAASVSAYAMPIIVFWLMFLIQKSKNLKWVWSILLWIWIVFIWVWYIQDWFEQLKESINLMAYSVEWFKWIIIFVIIWSILTLLLQSSHASILLIMAAIWSNQITYENALALVIWANIWTTITWVLWSLSSNTNWKRLALADIIMKLWTWIIFVLAIYQVIPLVDNIANLLWIPNEQIAFKIAIFHTIFNVIWVFVVLLFYKKFVLIVEKIIPERKVIQENSKWETIVKNLYLNDASAEFTWTAMIALVKETKHMYDNSINILLKILWLRIEDLQETNENWELDIDRIKQRIKIYEWDIDKLYWSKIKVLFGEIMNFSTQAQAQNSESNFSDFSVIRRANIKIIESVKTLKHMQKNLKRFLDSTNDEIKKEYEKIIEDLIYIIFYIEKLSKIEDNYEKIKLLSNMQKFVIDNDIVNNWRINELIWEKLITNEMATSLIKDYGYKNEICNNLIMVSEVVYNREIYTETEGKTVKNLSKSFGISSKKINKLLEKFKKRKSNLKTKLNKEKNQENILKIRKEIEEIEFLIKKYQD